MMVTDIKVELLSVVFVYYLLVSALVSLLQRLYSLNIYRMCLSVYVHILHAQLVHLGYN